LKECPVAGLCHRIVSSKRIKHANPPHSLRLLRAGDIRPRDRRAAEKRDELAPPHVRANANKAQG
jgi:hypothetical protein